MNKYFPLYMSLFLMMAMTVVSCSKKDEPETTVDEYTAYSTSTTLVSAFSLQANAKIASNLDSVAFTIDQDRGLIYNADSLPYGTRINAMCVNVTCASTVASRQFIIKNGERMADTTITYRNNSTDSIDFTGDVTLRITSRDGLNTRDYSVKVNVHKEKPDTLVWDAGRRRDLPNVTSSVSASKTVMQEDLFLCMADDNGSYILSSSEDPLAGIWNKTELSLPFVPNINSLAATDDAMYILDNTGELFTSKDKGANWTDCGVKWHSIIGAYDDRLLGVSHDGSGYIHVEYVNGSMSITGPADDNFPVSGMSQLVMASNEWTWSQQAMIAGGVLADGSLSNRVWGFDGKTWAVISNDNVLPAVLAPSMFCYYTYVVRSGTYTPVRRVTWMVIGGKLANGELNTTTYISRNQGITWSKGESGLQMPSYIPDFYGAQVYIYERKNNAGGVLHAYNPGHVTPVTEWESPYIYLFGGYEAGGTALNSVWEGVLRRLTYKPVF